MKTINIFFASASDAKELLEIAKNEIASINNMMQGKVHYNVLDWGSCTVSSMGNPEGEILKQIPIDEANYFVEVFRFKYGTPTGNINPNTMQPYNSGMEEEFFKAYDVWKKDKRLEMIIFKSEESIPRNMAVNYKELEKCEKFFKEFQADGKHPGLYNTYRSTNEFAEKFRKNILQRLYIEIRQDIPIEYQVYLQKKEKGFVDIYFDNDSDKRNKIKQREIETTSSLKLQANSGYSFIAMGTIHYPNIRKALERGMKFEIIMQNPWSLNAVYLALKASDFQNKQQYNQYLKRKLSVDEIIDVYKKSYWKTERFQTCMSGYERLKKDFKAKIELKVSDQYLSNSILLTDNYMFLEPYYNTIESDKKTISMFEMQMEKDSDLYKDTNAYFDILWQSGYAYNYFKKNEKKFEERLRESLERRL